MARAHFSEVAIDPQGNFLTEARVTVTLRGQSDQLASIYATETAQAGLPNPYMVSDGIVSHWADAGAYDVTIEDVASPPSLAPRVVGWGAVPGVQGGIPGSLIAAGTINNAHLAAGIDAAKLIDGSVTNSKLVDASVTDAKIVGMNGSKLTSGSVAVGALATSALNNFLKLNSAADRKVRWGAMDMNGGNYSGGFAGISLANVTVPHGFGASPQIVAGMMDTGVSTGDGTDIINWSWQDSHWDATNLYLRIATRTGGNINFPGIVFQYVAII